MNSRIFQIYVIIFGMCILGTLITKYNFKRAQASDLKMRFTEQYTMMKPEAIKHR